MISFSLYLISISIKLFTSSNDYDMFLIHLIYSFSCNFCFMFLLLDKYFIGISTESDVNILQFFLIDIIPVPVKFNVILDFSFSQSYIIFSIEIEYIHVFFKF